MAPATPDLNDFPMMDIASGIWSLNRSSSDAQYKGLKFRVDHELQINPKNGNTTNLVYIRYLGMIKDIKGEWNIQIWDQNETKVCDCHTSGSGSLGILGPKIKINLPDINISNLGQSLKTRNTKNHRSNSRRITIIITIIKWVIEN